MTKPENDEGAYLAQARSTDCGNCGREMEKAHRVHLGTGYCSICYPRIFPARRCHVCGKSARSHRNEEKPTCGECLREDRSCLRCGKLTPKASLRVGQRVACASCARYYHAPEPCDMCGTPSSRLSRSSGYPQNGRMCDKCLRSTVGATCSCCRKHRAVKLMTLDRKPLCVNCAAAPLATHPCADCGTVVGGTGASPCMSCGIKRANSSRFAGTRDLLATQAAREVYGNFVQWGNDTGRASKLATGASRYLQSLAKLDVALQQHAGPLDGALIVQTYSTEELRRMGLLSQYLAEAGLLNDDALMRRRRSEERLIAAKRDAIAGQPWAADIDRFERDLSTRERAISLRSRKSYLHAAVSLLTQAKVARAPQVGQKALDSLVAKKPGLKASLSVFVSHLNRLHGLRLKLKPKAAETVPLVRQARYVRILLDGIESSTERPARLALTAKLLSKLLNAPLERILQLRHSDLDLQDFRNLRLDGRWLELPSHLHSILVALPSPQWEAGLDADPFLFEGRMLMDSLSASAVEHHVKPLARARLGA